MDAALITGMFNVGFNSTIEPTKDVFTKKESDFKDVLTKNIEKDKSKDVKNKSEINNKDVEKKNVKKKEKKITDSDENGNEKINGLIEKRLENVENISDKLENIELASEGLANIQDELKNGLVQNVYEVGPQSVETEKITLDKFEKFEEKLDSLAEKLGMSVEDNKEDSFGDGAELNMDSDSESELDSSFMSSEQNDVLNIKDGKKEEVKNKDDKFSITDFRKKDTLNNNVEQLEMDVQNMDEEIHGFDITSTNNVVMNRAERLQEQIDVLKQITEKVTVNILEDKSEMLIKLKPDNLGKVTMQIAVENGNVTAKFLAESERVKEILESSMQDLKDHLAKQGMVVQDLSVSVGNENREREMFNQSNSNYFRHGRTVDKIEKGSYFSSNGFYEAGEEGMELSAFWPDSTVSFSA